MDAIGLLLGQRASSDLVGPQQDVCMVSAVLQHQRVAVILADFGLSSQPEEPDVLVVRRRITEHGRSQSWLNDQPVTVTVLTQVMRQLVICFAQHAHIQLSDHHEQYRLIDSAGDHDALLHDYRQSHLEVRRLLQRRDELIAGAQNSVKELDYHQFLLNEFDQLSPQPGELSQLLQDQRLLADAETWQTVAGQNAQQLVEHDDALVSLIAKIAQSLSQAPDEHLSQAETLCWEAQELLKEAGQLCLQAQDRLQADPQRLSWIDDRLAGYDVLQRKHGETEQEILQAWEVCAERVQALSQLGEEREKITDQLKDAESKREQLGIRLTQVRSQIAKRLLKDIHQQLANLGMPKATLSWHDGLVQPSEHAWQHQYLMVQTNPGVPAGPVGDLASGGEASRIMLAISAATAAGHQPALMIFDEVDSGVGGRLGRAIGQNLAKLAQDKSVLVITHTPQVAACADQHFVVQKIQDDCETKVTLTHLTGEDRVKELADMFGGGMEAETQARALLEAG